MGKHRKSKKPLGDHEQGYKRPPKNTRFQPGQSGNPKGRPKKPDSFGEKLNRVLAERVRVGDGDKAKMMDFEDFIIRGIVTDAAKRIPTAQKLLVSLLAHRNKPEAMIDTDVLEAEDQAILDAYIARAREVPPENGVDETHPDGDTESPGQG